MFLRADGTAFSYSQSYTRYYADSLSWTNIIAISRGDEPMFGLTADGTVLACGEFYSGRVKTKYGRQGIILQEGDEGYENVGKYIAPRYDLSDWENIVAIASGGQHVIGLKADGTVVAVGDNNFGQCDVSDWKDIRLPEK